MRARSGVEFGAAIEKEVSRRNMGRIMQGVALGLDTALRVAVRIGRSNTSTQQADRYH